MAYVENPKLKRKNAENYTVEFRVSCYARPR
jgi:hypothetical protein